MSSIPSFQSRFAITLVANVIRGMVTLGLGVMLARLFGATDYGRIAFLLATFVALKQLLDLGTSSAFFTFLSRKNRSTKFLFQFWLFFFGKYFLASIIIFCIFPDAWVQSLWHGEKESLISLAMFATAVQFDMWPNASQMPESQRKTMLVQLIFISALVMQVLSVIVLYFSEWLTLVHYLVSVVAIWLVASATAALLYESDTSSENVGADSYSLREYFDFCKPIAPFLFIGFISDFLDRWMLQEWGGSQQQGYFAIAQQISGVTLIITASVIRMVWKEVAEALHRNDLELAKNIYLAMKRILFLIGAVISSGVIPWGEEILVSIYGPEFGAAWGVFVIMMFYSMHQSLGQVEGAFVMASGQTRLGLRFNLVMIPLGPMASYFLISQNVLGELIPQSGAVGLALKMVIFQIISVNVVGLLIGKFYGWSFEWRYQWSSLLVLLTIIPKT